MPLRQLLHQYINSKDKSNDSRKRRYKPDELNEKTEIILNLIKLYKSDPMLALAVSLNLFNILINLFKYFPYFILTQFAVLWP